MPPPWWALTKDADGNDLLNDAAWREQTAEADQIARAAYHEALVELDNRKFEFTSQLQREQFAWQKATQAWTQAFQEKSLQVQVDSARAQLEQSYRMHGDRLRFDEETRRLEQDYRAAQQRLQRDLQKEDQQFRREMEEGRYGHEIAQLGRQQAFQREQNEADRGIQGLQLLASLRGPRDAFKQQEVAHGLNQQGVSRAVDAIAGRFTPPRIQAPQATPEPVTLASLSGLTGYQPAPGTGPAFKPPEPFWRPMQLRADQAPQLPPGFN